MKLLSSIFFVCVFSAFSFSNTTSLEVKVTNMETDEGILYFLMFNQAEGFPDDPTKAIYEGSMPANFEKSSFIFENLSEGTYAISVYQDENGNGKMDSNFLGIPKEKVGASNFSKKLSKPTFNECKFEVKGGEKTQQLEITFFN